LLLELGADINWDGGYQCLFLAAIIRLDKKLTELFIEYGANVNAMNFEGIIEPILQTVRNEGVFYRMEKRDKDAQLNDEIEDLLLRHGAKYFDECYTKNLKNFLNIVALYDDTGLATYGGKIKIEDIESIPQPLKIKFNVWLKRYDYEKINAEHIKEGEILAREIKNYIPKEIKLKYYYGDKVAWSCYKNIAI
jgi:hypothetical protein